MNLTMRLLEILIQSTIILMFSYAILTYWGFDTKHFLMIAEGQVPKRIQMYKPSTHNPVTKNNISSNKESLAKTTDEDPMIEKSLSSVSSTTSTTLLEK